jgi:hypothetical protein
MVNESEPRPVNYRPIHPEDADQGDPYPLVVPQGVEAAYRYYVYVTTDVVTPKAFPVYASNDLVHWKALGPTLVADSVPRAYWAPCICYVPGLARPYVMLYSRSVGAGEEAHVGHTIRRADSERPEGPFIDSGHVLTADIDFAIDPDVYRAPDGSLRLAYATDFVSDAPLGTGIVEVGVSEDLTRVLTPPSLLARASEDWHLYDAKRTMPWKQIPSVDWSTQTVVWNTVEAPVGGLINPRGQRVYLYSGGCFFGFYGVGALVEDGGRLVNVTRSGRNFVLRPAPELGFHGPGHCAWLRGLDGKDYLVAHARFGSPSAPRNAMLVELLWDEQGLPYCPPVPALSQAPA